MPKDMENVMTMNEMLLAQYKDMLVRCFACNAACTVEDMGVCIRCNAGSCGSKDCTGRCVCSSNHHVEHPEKAKVYYAYLDEMNTGKADKSRAAFIECQLELIEHQMGW
jgi:hypothetical protein